MEEVDPTVARLVVARAEDRGEALRFEGRSWTWAEVVAEAAARARLFGELRRPGPFHVGVLLENVPDHVFAILGGALAGATIVSLNPTHRGEELAFEVRHTECQFLITESSLAQGLEGLDTGVPDDRRFVIDSQSWDDTLTPFRGSALPASLPSPEALFVLLFTSGSTGRPKAVQVSQRRAARSGTSVPFGIGPVNYCAMPLFHGNALFLNLVAGVASGSTILLRRRFTASGWLDDVREHGVTFTTLLGRSAAYILATPPTSRDRDHRLDLVLAQELGTLEKEAFETRFGVSVFEGYGSSEGAIRLSKPSGAEPGVLGSAPPGVDLAVVDPETLLECPPASIDSAGRLENPGQAIGELVRRDPVATAGFEGYWNNPEADAERVHNGWFWSGDLAWRDTDGVFHFAGRTADRLRVDGENFAAAPIERILARFADVSGVAVYAVPDVGAGDEVMAAIELHPGATFDHQAFEAFLAHQPDLGSKWAPRYVRVIDNLPVIGPGKVARASLRRQAWRTEDQIWWRKGRTTAYRPFTGRDREELESGLAERGRLVLLEA